MKAARRIRAYLDARAETKTTETYVFSIRTEAGYVHGVQVKDLEALLASRARYRRRARAEHKAAQSLLAANAALLMENAALQEQLRKERAATTDAQRRYLMLRQGLREVCAAVLPAYADRDPGHQLSALQTALHTARRVSHGQENANAQLRTAASSAGVQAISEARAYQQAHYPQDTPGRRQQLFQAALALLIENESLYPFGAASWNGIKRNAVQGYGGRKAQLAHAGACIAALIDLLPPAPQAQPGTDYRERRARDHAAYPGEAGDLL